MYTNSARNATRTSDLVEKFTLIPSHHEISVNGGSLDGAVDLFSYGPEPEQAFRPLGALYVVGHRDTDSGNMGYIVSLIAALARREYYAAPDVEPREAFARTLKKINEIVDEFFASSDLNLSIGIFAIAGGTLMVSKLDKFKILLARDGQIVDVLNNVALFTKEHVERRRFSSVISGAVQAGDRLMAYYPAKSITARERALRSYLTTLPYAQLAAKLDDLGRQHPTFAAAIVHIDMVQESETVTPTVETVPQPALAWAPRQQAATPATSPQVPPHEEVPHLIPTEFSLGTRRGALATWLGRAKFVRLDTRGKAIFLASAAVVVMSTVVLAKSVLFVNPQQQKLRQVLQSVQRDFDLAKTKISQNEPAPARQILMRAVATLAGDDVRTESDARQLSASIVQAMDTLDNAQSGALALVAQAVEGDRLTLAAFSSVSQSLWAVARQSDDTLAVLEIRESVTGRTALAESAPSAIIPFGSGALVLDATAKNLTRVTAKDTKTFAIPTQDTILDAASYEGNVYVLTDHAILKIADLDTDKPVTKQWLTDVNDLTAGAAQLYVDGSIRTLGRDGMLTTYYKGKKTGQVQAALEPSGNWHLLAGPQDGQLAVANADTKRIYLLDTTAGSLVRTVKVDTDQPVLEVFSGTAGSILFVTKDSKIWSVK